jgi:hypothetical protein
MAKSFSWSLEGLDIHQFTAFGNLLALRNGGQVEPASLGNEALLQDESDNDSDAESIDTSRPQQISDSGHDNLKRKFLDCLAEFAANKKGGLSVACSAMKEAEEGVEIWIARNDGFSNKDQVLFDELGQLLSSISCSRGTQLTD